jgi:hypothetical protein
MKALKKINEAPVEMGMSYSTHAERRNACRVLAEKSERKVLLGRPRRNGRIILKWILEK